MTRIVIALVVMVAVAACLEIASLGEAEAAPVCGSIYPADPAKLAKSLEPVFDRLNDGVPSLSPKEKQWLKDELASSDTNRWLKANRSLEITQQRVKTDATSLAISIQILTGSFLPPKQQMTPREQWRFIAYTLIDSDAALLLARLVAKGVIAKDAIPTAWKRFADPGKGYPLSSAIRDSRLGLARHILICTLEKL